MVLGQRPVIFYYVRPRGPPGLVLHPPRTPTDAAALPRASLRGLFGDSLLLPVIRPQLGVSCVPDPAPPAVLCRQDPNLNTMPRKGEKQQGRKGQPWPQQASGFAARDSIAFVAGLGGKAGRAGGGGGTEYSVGRPLTASTNATQHQCHGAVPPSPWPSGTEASPPYESTNRLGQFSQVGVGPREREGMARLRGVPASLSVARRVA
jgi:hypothetical protein